MKFSRADVIDLMKKDQGGTSLRAYARKIGVTPAYISDVFLGRRHPGPAILSRFKLKAERTTTTVYVKVK